MNLLTDLGLIASLFTMGQCLALDVVDYLNEYESFEEDDDYYGYYEEPELGPHGHHHNHHRDQLSELNLNSSQDPF